MELTATKYKQTEVGLIPVDWEFENLLQNFTLKARIGWQGLTTAEYLPIGEYGLVTGTDFKNGYIDWDNCVYVERNRFIQDKNIQLKVGDVLVTKDGTIGKVAFIDRLPNPTTLNSGVFVVRPKNTNIDNRYFYYLLMSSYFDVFLTKITAGSTITHLYQKDFVTFNFVLPTLTEQKAIAQVLSDTDALIQALEKKIAKKKLIKKGASQQLLFGKNRLKGFETDRKSKKSVFGDIPDDWDVKPLPDVFNYIHGKAHEQFIVDNGSFEVVNSKFVSSEGAIVKYSSDNFCPAKKGDILTVLSDLPNGKALAKTFFVEDDNRFAVNQRICIWRSKSDDPLFMYYFMNRHKYFLKFDDGVTQTHILNHHINECPVLVPRNIDEQIAIGNALHAMDEEIKILEQKLAKYQLAKQGMMQQLLTGKIRLV